MVHLTEFYFRLESSLISTFKGKTKSMSLAVAHPQVYVLIKKNISWIISVCVYGNTESGCVGPLHAPDLHS